MASKRFEDKAGIEQGPDCKKCYQKFIRMHQAHRASKTDAHMNAEHAGVYQFAIGCRMNHYYRGRSRLGT